MDCWNFLDIAPYADKRTIKRAYSKKLKIMRPEEHPKQFQQLHEAYKAALLLSESQSSDSAETLSIHQCQLDDSDSLYEPIEEYDSLEETSSNIDEFINVSDNTKYFDASYQSEYTKLLTQTKSLMSGEVSRQTPEKWEFLLDSEYLLEPNFNSELGKSIFKIIVEHNNTHKKKSQRVPSKVLVYLDNLFHWKKEEEYLSWEVGHEKAKAVFFYLFSSGGSGASQPTALQGLKGGASVTKLESNFRGKVDTEDYIANPALRALAFIIDLAILFPILYLLYPYFSNMYSEYYDPSGKFYFLVCIPLFSIYFWLTESSKLEGSLGKWVLGLKVVDKNINPLNKSQSFWRAVLFGITACFSFMTLFINLYLATRLGHDYGSKSYVVNLKSSIL